MKQEIHFNLLSMELFSFPYFDFIRWWMCCYFFFAPCILFRILDIRNSWSEHYHHLFYSPVFFYREFYFSLIITFHGDIFARFVPRKYEDSEDGDGGKGGKWTKSVVFWITMKNGNSNMVMKCRFAIELWCYIFHSPYSCGWVSSQMLTIQKRQSVSSMLKRT